MNAGPFAIEKLVGPPSALHALISTGVDCPTAPDPVVTLDTESRYDPKDKKAIEVDEDRAATYREKVAPVREFLRAVVEAANRSVAEPHARRAWADCAAGLLDGWAEAGALAEMETTTAKLIRGSQIAGLSLAALQLREALGVDDPRMERIAAWLAGLARDGRDFVDSRPEAGSSRANHRYWNGLAAAAAGSLAGDGGLV
ncbi:MAG: alginate lyase family protein, partial [Alphaproteobacteria bacterium]